MPRAALLSIHARVAGTEPATWEDPSLVQLWGPRFSVFVVAARDLAVFSLGTLPDDAKGRRRAEDLAARLERRARRRADDLRRGGRRARRAPQQPQVRGGDRHGPDPVGGRAAAGRLDRAAAGGRPPRGPPRTRRAGTCTSTAPPRPAAFGRWSGIGPRPARRRVRGARRVADAGADAGRRRVDPRPGRGGLPRRPRARGARAAAAQRRRVSSCCHGADRDLLVPDAGRRDALWTPRVWPGGLLVGGEVAGTWRRADAALTVQPWRRLSRRGTRRGRGGGGGLAAARHRAADRRPLGRLSRAQPHRMCSPPPGPPPAGYPSGQGVSQAGRIPRAPSSAAVLDAVPAGG